MKKQLKWVVGILLGMIILVGIILAVIYQEPKVAVLCYHNLATKEEKEKYPEEKDWIIEVANFEEQLQYLQKHHYKTLTLEEFKDWKEGKIEVPQKSVLITFDDGFLSNYHYAFPLLKKYNMNATIFLIGQYMKQEEESKQVKKWKSNVKEYMNMETIAKAKQEYPNIDFASHSYWLHYQKSISEKSQEQLTNDVKSFNQEITQTKAYAYPFGANNDKMIQALKDADYDLAFIYGPTKKEYRKASRKDDNYKIPRLNVSHGMEVSKFALRLALPF